MNKKDLTSRCTGIYFGEGPRWKENKLWFSDMPVSYTHLTLPTNGCV